MADIVGDREPLTLGWMGSVHGNNSSFVAAQDIPDTSVYESVHRRRQALGVGQSFAGQSAAPRSPRRVGAASPKFSAMRGAMRYLKCAVQQFDEHAGQIRIEALACHLSGEPGDVVASGRVVQSG